MSQRLSEDWVKQCRLLKILSNTEQGSELRSMGGKVWEMRNEGQSMRWKMRTKSSTMGNWWRWLSVKGANHRLEDSDLGYPHFQEHQKVAGYSSISPMHSGKHLCPLEGGKLIYWSNHCCEKWSSRFAQGIWVVVDEFSPGSQPSGMCGRTC